MKAQPHIEDLLPHRPPMLLLDELLDHGENWARCRVVPRTNLCAEKDGRVPAALALEYMAQSVGVLAALREFHRGQPPRIGYLVAARELTLATDGFSAGVPLTVEVKQIWGEAEAGQFSGRVLLGEQALAWGTLTVVRPAGEGKVTT